jgi:hypothetical protein
MVCGGSLAGRVRSARARFIALSHAKHWRSDVSRVAMQPSTFLEMRALQNSIRLRRSDRVSACHATRSRFAAKLSPLATVTTLPVQSILTSGTLCSLSHDSTSKVMLPLPSNMMIRGGNGVLKVRWRRQGAGKRGGVRAITFYRNAEMPVFLLLVYAKAQRDDMTPDQKKHVRELTAELRQTYGRKG